MEGPDAVLNLIDVLAMADHVESHLSLSEQTIPNTSYSSYAIFNNGPKAILISICR
jgi:hypothetical protein